MSKSWLHFRYWIIGGLAGLVIVCFVAYEQQRAAHQYLSHRSEYCANISSSTAQKTACIEEHTNTRDYLPWWYELVAWPDGVGAWAIILTLITIARQTYETRRSAAATEKSVSIARRQIEMMKDKERARIEIKAESLKLTKTDSSFWYFVGDLKLRNLGISRAYITTFQAEIIWYESTSALPVPDIPDQGNLFQDSYMDPTEDWDKSSPTQVHFFNTDSINLDWFAAAVYEGRVAILMRGVIEYGTVGTTYRRLFCFEWHGAGRPDSYAHLLGGSPPTTNENRVSYGYWKTQMDEEHEIEGPRA